MKTVGNRNRNPELRSQIDQTQKGLVLVATTQHTMAAEGAAAAAAMEVEESGHAGGVQTVHAELTPEQPPPPPPAAAATTSTVAAATALSSDSIATLVDHGST